MEARVQEEAGGSSPAGPREDTPADPYLADPSGHPSVLDLKISKTWRRRRGARRERRRARACTCLDDIRARLSRRLIEDEWLALIASVAATDFRRDRKKPRVRARDRRCNQPKARQGWTKKAMRAARVRVCAPGATACSPRRARYGSCACRARTPRTQRTQRVTRSRESTRMPRKNPRRRKKKKERVTRVGRVVALDVSSFLPGAGAEALAASVALGGPFAAARAIARTRRARRPRWRPRRVFLGLRLRLRRIRRETAPRSPPSGNSARRAFFSPRRRARRTCVAAATRRSVAKTKAFKRHLKVSPGGADASDARRIYGLIGVCGDAHAGRRGLVAMGRSGAAAGRPRAGRRTPWPWTKTRARKRPASAPRRLRSGVRARTEARCRVGGRRSVAARGTRRRVRDFGKTFLDFRPEFRAIGVKHR